MTELDVYNFQAPQFIESLSEVKLDDGADTFFDPEEFSSTAPDKTSKKNKKRGSTENVEGDEIVSENEENQETELDKNAINENDENVDPVKPSNNRRITRLQRMSTKPDGPLGKKDHPKFLSVAEQLHKFHHSTPPRFKRKSALFKSTSCKFLPTIAHSPQLRTKIRAARPSTAPSVVPEVKPVTRSIRKKESVKPFVAIKPIPKPPTIPVPFKLTMPGSFKKQVDKKDDTSENTKEVSKEKKQVLATPSSVMRKPLPVKKKRLEIQDNKLTVKESWAVTGIKTIEKPNSTTKTVPFSFEKRNQERLLEKQKKLEAKEQVNKASTSATPRKVPRPSTVSQVGSTVKPSKVKDEGRPEKTPRKSVK